MIYTIENESMTVRIKARGAEVCSVVEKKTGREYMWNADPVYWGRTSPILFPFVGGLKNGGFSYAGTEYHIGKHGFARDMDFQLEKQEAESIWFSLEDTEETRKSYPFSFRLLAGYILHGTQLEVKWCVENRNDRTMYFALGGHPAFACPPSWQQGKRTDCSIWFDQPKQLVSELIGSDGLVSGEQKVYELRDGILPVTTGLFDRDALIMDQGQVHEIALCDLDNKPYVRVQFDADYVGVWSMPDDNASFICIEPWYGRCDNSDFQGSLEERKWGNRLEAGGVFEAGYTICFE
ncbi:MAG: aldose 1-epimerase family protein [Lachnospiraceae bacterium]|nr:aldose 1-epimerase family protein [Lachnospiraceae bacterium]